MKRGTTDLHQHDHDHDIGDCSETMAATGYLSVGNSEFPQADMSHDHQGILSQNWDRYLSSVGEEDFGYHPDVYIITASTSVTTSSSVQRLTSTYGNIPFSTYIVFPIQTSTSSGAQLLALYDVIISLTTRTVILIAATTSSSAQSLATSSGRCRSAREFRG